MEGWIKLYRQTIKWEWYQDANVFRLFIHLLLMANSEDKEWRGITIKRGQLFTSVQHLCIDLKLTAKQIRIAMDKLEKGKQIDVKGASNGTMITIYKYDTYQSNAETEGQTKGKQQGIKRATNKKYSIIESNNTIIAWRESFEKYIENAKSEFEKSVHDKEFIKQQQLFNPNVDIVKTIYKAWITFWGTEAGWKHKKKGRADVIDWRRTIVNAISLPGNKVYYTKQELAEMERK